MVRSKKKSLKRISPKSKQGLNLLKGGGKNSKKKNYRKSDIKHIAQYKNGTHAVVLKNGKQIFLTGGYKSSKSKLKKISQRRKTYRKTLSKEQALKVFRSYYNNSSKSGGAMKLNTKRKSLKRRSKKSQKRRSSKKYNQNQHGGKRLSLESAVKLLRKYYKQKYSN
tara:strand:+ start:2011 stop:2508 length:498 start_codon:yes stop_codon:yes gene_type:complete